jgi:hypothetical protein
MTTRNPDELQIALPPGLEIQPDPLRLRLDFYADSIMMFSYEGPDNLQRTRLVAPVDIARALAGETIFISPLLPPTAVLWAESRHGSVLLIYRAPQLTHLALAKEVLAPPRRFHVPMPGLIFACVQGNSSPWVWAVKQKPKTLQDPVFRAPTFNVFDSGRVCPGTHEFPEDPELVPESFFRSLFSRAADSRNRSERFDDLELLWEDLEQRKAKRYPAADLVRETCARSPATIESIMGPDGPVLRGQYL